MSEVHRKIKQRYSKDDYEYECYYKNEGYDYWVRVDFPEFADESSYALISKRTLTRVCVSNGKIQKKEGECKCVN